MAAYARKEITKRVAKITRTFRNIYENMKTIEAELFRTENREYLRNISRSVYENVKALDIEQQLMIKSLYDGSDRDLYRAMAYMDYAFNLLSLYDNKLRFISSELDCHLPLPLFD